MTMDALIYDTTAALLSEHQCAPLTEESVTMVVNQIVNIVGAAGSDRAVESALRSALAALVTESHRAAYRGPASAFARGEA